MAGKRGNPMLKKGGPSLNPNGRTKGSKNKLTLLQNGLIDQFAGEMNKEFKAVIKTVIREAKNGDMTAARLLLDRAIPARKAVEHYGAQDGNNIVINIKGLEDVNLNAQPFDDYDDDDENDELIDAEYEEINHGVQNESKPM
tara:strand:- start:1348 stop:1773 length:426 start_codon:yes stop_codon:yes gene_type:complete